jgi:hypothetical protein
MLQTQLLRLERPDQQVLHRNEVQNNVSTSVSIRLG